MSKIDQVDLSKPVKFYGCRVVESDHPALVLLSEALNDKRVRLSTEAVGASAVIAGEDAKALLGYARGTRAGAELRGSLTGEADSAFGEPLLIGGVSFDAFRAFLNAAAGWEECAEVASGLLAGRCQEWWELSADEVRVTAYRRPGQVVVLPARPRLVAIGGRGRHVAAGIR
ncbi:MAG: hypothetical protein RLN99_11575 [Kiloniellaceae bacterium]